MSVPIKYHPSRDFILYANRVIKEKNIICNVASFVESLGILKSTIEKCTNVAHRTGFIKNIFDFNYNNTLMTVRLLDQYWEVIDSDRYDALDLFKTFLSMEFGEKMKSIDHLGEALLIHWKKA